MLGTATSVGVLDESVGRMLLMARLTWGIHSDVHGWCLDESMRSWFQCRG